MEPIYVVSFSQMLHQYATDNLNQQHKDQQEPDSILSEFILCIGICYYYFTPKDIVTCISISIVEKEIVELTSCLFLPEFELNPQSLH